jgi:hypothetical protein
VTIADARKAAVDNGARLDQPDMPTLPSLLIAASALTILMLGSMHLRLTFPGNAFESRDPFDPMT